MVFTGDLKEKLNKKVDEGEELFQVGSLDDLRAELSVPEDDIADVKLGRHGELATASYPGQRISFTVERINPVAEIDNDTKKNVFKVRVLLDQGEIQPWMRRGWEASRRSTGKRRVTGRCGRAGS